MNPVTHLHLKSSPSLSQLPPCWQGLLRHESKTAHEKIRVKWIRLQTRWLIRPHHHLTPIPQHVRWLVGAELSVPLYVMLVRNSLWRRNLWGCWNDFRVGVYIIYLCVILVGSSKSSFTTIQQKYSGLEQSNLLTRSTIHRSDNPP